MHEAFSQDKVRASHLDREACLYVRQSSPRQVVEHGESGLRQRAVALGWQEERIRVIDEDQGKSGTLASNRSGFRDLMARVAAAEVGIVLALEASRLARNNGDWSQLVQVARITDTLILDEIAVYDPNYPPDMLVLGILGVLAEYELQNQRAHAGRAARAAAAGPGL
ncbi:MAG: recombinase family protein [Bryobacterales bacterium]|nr:recombinase family protein [Bryobacterales bacterium]